MSSSCARPRASQLYPLIGYPLASPKGEPLAREARTQGGSALARWLTAASAKPLRPCRLYVVNSASQPRVACLAKLPGIGSPSRCQSAGQCWLPSGEFPETSLLDAFIPWSGSDVEHKHLRLNGDMRWDAAASSGLGEVNSPSWLDLGWPGAEGARPTHHLRAALYQRRTTSFSMPMAKRSRHLAYPWRVLKRPQASFC